MITAQPELTLRFTTGRKIRLTPAEVGELRQLLGMPLPVPAPAPTLPAEPDWSRVK